MIYAKKYLEILTQANLKSSAGEDISKQGGSVTRNLVSNVKSRTGSSELIRI